MRKSTARGLGFVGAVGATVALIGAAVSTTGAYFTDAKDGSMSATTGNVKIDTSDTTLAFQGLRPTEYKTQKVDFANTGTGKQDIWFVIPSGQDSNLYQGMDSNTALGRFGHFRLTSSGGAGFVSNNLRTGPADSRSVCGVNGNGSGGSETEATTTNNTDNGSYVDYCPVPKAILLQQNVSPGEGGSMTVEFGLTKVAKNGYANAAFTLGRYKIVATQPGIRPDDVNNNPIS